MNLSSLLTLEKATNNWPRQNTGPFRYRPMNLSVWPCALFVVMALNPVVDLTVAASRDTKRARQLFELAVVML